MAGDVSRRNGARSRGPVSAQGKQRSRLNALRHGLAASAASQRPDEGRAATASGPASVLTGERRRRALERARLLGLPVPEGQGDDVLTALSLAVAHADLEIEAIERRKLALLEEATLVAELDATLRGQYRDAIDRAPVARARGPRPPSPQAEHDDEDAARAITELKTLSLPRPRRGQATILSLGINERGGDASRSDQHREGASGLETCVELTAWAEAIDGIRRLDRYVIRAQTRRRRAWRELQRRLRDGPSRAQPS